MKLNRILAGATAFVLALGLLAGTAAAAGKPAPTGKVNLNSASVEQLSTLPGVGAKLAAASSSTARSPAGSSRPRS